MRPYRSPEQPPAPPPPLAPYSYATQIDSKRKRVVLNTLKIMVCLIMLLGLVPERWLKELDPALLGAGMWLLLLVSAVLAVRGAQGNAARDVEAYEQRLLGAHERRRKRRRHSAPRRRTAASA